MPELNAGCQSVLFTVQLTGTQCYTASALLTTKEQIHGTKCFFSESLQAGQLATFKKATLRRREKTEVFQERNLSTDVKGQQHVHARLHVSSPS